MKHNRRAFNIPIFLVTALLIAGVILYLRFQSENSENYPAVYKSEKDVSNTSNFKILPLSSLKPIAERSEPPIAESAVKDFIGMTSDPNASPS